MNRQCEFCGCHTNAKTRCCCEKGCVADGGDPNSPMNKRLIVSWNGDKRGNKD